MVRLSFNFCLVFLPFICASSGLADNGDDFFQEVNEFVGCNAAKVVDIWMLDGNEETKLASKMMRNLIFTKSKPIRQMLDHRRFPGVFHLLLVDKPDNLDSALMVITDAASNFTQRSFLLVAPFEISDTDLQAKLKLSLTTPSKNLFFYLTHKKARRRDHLAADLDRPEPANSRYQ
jgi:hypothetical protein